MKTLIVAAAFFALVSSAHAQNSTLRPLAVSASVVPVSIFASISGQKSGVIKGEVIQKGREGLHQILDFDMAVASPRDAASGLATGKRQHKPLRILKKVNSGSPMLFTAIATNENLPMVRFDFWEPNKLGIVGGGGVEVVTQTITLQNASIASWRQFIHPDLGFVEEIQFTYQKITIENKLGKTAGQDDWMARN